MAHFLEESHRVYEEGDHSRAKELSDEGKRHKAEMDRLNKEAEEWIFYRKDASSFSTYLCACSPTLMLIYFSYLMASMVQRE